MNFYDTCQLDLINIEPEKQIELIPVDHKRKQKETDTTIREVPIL